MPLLATDRTVLRPTGQGRVVEAVHQWIKRGEIIEGDPLPTMRQMAQTLNVDKGTVCRAMSSLQDDGLIRREGRRLHWVGRTGSTHKTSGLLSSTVLVLTSIQPVAGGRRNTGWLANVVQGLLTAAQAQQIHTMLVHPATINSDEFDRLIAGRPMGCVIIASGLSSQRDQAILEQLKTSDIPIVLFGEEINSNQHDMVTGDHCKGARQLTHWLADRGAKRILRYWPYNIERRYRPTWLGHRDEGYEQAVDDLGLESLPPLEFVRPALPGLDSKAYFEARCRQAAGYLVDHLLGPDRVDAIMVATDRFAYEVAAACRLIGIKPNKDVLIAGYDGDWEQCKERQWESTGPAVTVSQYDETLGRQLMKVLFDRKNHPEASPQLCSIPPQVVAVETNQTQT